MTALKLNNELDVPVELADVHCTRIQKWAKSFQICLLVFLCGIYAFLFRQEFEHVYG